MVTTVFERILDRRLFAKSGDTEAVVLGPFLAFV